MLPLCDSAMWMLSLDTCWLCDASVWMLPLCACCHCVLAADVCLLPRGCLAVAGGRMPLFKPVDLVIQ
jgi:hypothetical protein